MQTEVVRVDFEKVGYECPGDWARLRDLVPDDLNAAEKEAFRLVGSKIELSDFLLSAGVGHELKYNAETAKVRNIS